MPDDNKTATTSPLIQSTGSMFPRKESLDNDFFTIDFNFLKMVTSRLVTHCGYSPNHATVEDVLMAAEYSIKHWEEMNLWKAEDELTHGEMVMRGFVPCHDEAERLRIERLYE